MRKVYHSDKSMAAMMMALSTSIGLTVVLFAALPFAHQVATPDRGVDLVKANTVDLPDEVDVEEMPPPEPETTPEAEPEPQLTDTPQSILPTANLDLATGSGGALEGYGDVAAPTAVQTLTEVAFDVKDLEKRPVPVSQTPPVYPDELRRTKVSGSVTIIFLLTEDGMVEDPRVESSSRPEFERPALEAVRKWRFEPGMKDGEAVRTYIRQPIRFSVSTG